MYQNPTLFGAVTNREGWLQIAQIADDDTGQLIALTDSNNNPLYAINLEIIEASPRGHFSANGLSNSPWYDECGSPIITGSLSNYISIVDVGTIQIKIPKSVMATLCPGKTYDVYLTVADAPNDDGRQIFIGRLPVLYGGRNT